MTEAGKPARSKLPRGRGRPTQVEKASIDIAHEATISSVSALNGMAGLFLGEDCRMTDPEYRTITDPLQRMLERADPATIEVVAVYADPLQCGMGLLSWIVRVVRTVSERSAGEEGPPQGPAPDEPVEPPSPDGHKELESEQLGEELGGPREVRVIQVPTEMLRRPQPGIRTGE